ncbi:MAG: FecCD family ABC transporter permease, partial [Streptosporangiales bacterium]
LGVSSGASTGAASVILFGVGTGAGLGAGTLPAAAFIGALLATAGLFLVSRTGGTATSMRLLLSGVTVGYLLYAATSFLIFASGDPEGSRAVQFWLLGSLALSGWLLVSIAAVAVVVTLVALLLWSRQLDALSIGDDTALTLGVAPTRFRVRVLIAVALCVGAVVAVSGSIGFVGLVVPHVARRFVGGTHRLALPVAAMVGAIFLVWADVAARMVLRPQELPIGIVTAVCGAPFLLVLIRRFHQPGA